MNFVTRRYAPYNKLHQADTASRLRLLLHEQAGSGRVPGTQYLIIDQDKLGACFAHETPG